MHQAISDGAGLPSVSWMTAVVQMIDQYRMVALLVVCLAVAITLLRGQTKDVGFWLCWSVVGLCSLLIIGSDAKKLLTGGTDVGGGTIKLVPNQMYVYSDEANKFYVARLRNGTFLDRNDYQWIRLNSGSEEEFTHVSFLIDQNKKKITRDSTTLAVVGDSIEPAPIRFNVEVPVEQLDQYRNRSLDLDLHTPPGALPFILQGPHKIIGKVVDPDGADDDASGTSGTPGLPGKLGLSLISAAYGDQPAPSLDSALNSAEAAQRAQAVHDLQSHFNEKTAWMNQVLVDPASSSDLRLTVITTIRGHFREDNTIAYPHPAQFQFLAPAAYSRMILDGLDTTTALGVNSRLLLNNVRDERVHQSFDLISQKVFSTSDSAHKSCLALFNLSVNYNWAYLIADQQFASGQPFTQELLASILGIIDYAKQNSAQLAGDDTIQAARLDYIKAVIYGRLATSAPTTLAPNMDSATMLQNSKAAFTEFLNAVPEAKRPTYRYPAQFDVAKAFLANPVAVSLVAASGHVNPEHGCSDPGEAS